MTDAQRRLLAAFEVALRYLPDDFCDEQTTVFMRAPSRFASQPLTRAQINAAQQDRELGQPIDEED